MKRLFTLLAFCFTLTNGFGQQILNGDFENYHACGTNQCPDDWSTDVHPNGGNIVSPGYNSNTAFRFLVPAGESSSGWIVQSVQLISKPSALEFFYKSNFQPGDNALISIYMYKNKQEIGNTYSFVQPHQTGFTSISIPINYPTSDIPDSAMITIFGSEDLNGIPGTEFIIDDVHFTNSVTAIYSISSNIGEVSLFPSPSDNGFTALSFVLQKSTGVTIEVFDILGKRVKAVLQDEPKQAGFQNINIDLSELDNGIYFTSIKTSDGSSITKKLIISK